VERSETHCAIESDGRWCPEGGAAPTHERIVEIVRRVERGEVTPRPELLFDA